MEDLMRRKREFDRAKRMAAMEADELEHRESNINSVVERAPMASMAVAGNSIAATKGAETITPVDPVRSVVTHPFQDVVNVMLPYKVQAFQATVSCAATPAITDVYTTSWRLNTPLDIQTAYTYAADPAPAADAAAGTANRPMYWNYWSTFYKYYTVTHCHYKISIKTRTSNSRYGKFSAWTYHHGMQGPPTIDGVTFAYPNDRYRSFHKHARCTPIREHNAAVEPTITKVIEGDYYPGRYSVQNDVVEDDLAETWHKTTEVPPLKEWLTLIIQKADEQETNALGQSLWDITYEFFYHVQFRDLYEIYTYPTVGQDLAAITDYSDQTN